MRGVHAGEDTRLMSLSYPRGKLSPASSYSSSPPIAAVADLTPSPSAMASEPWSRRRSTRARRSRSTSTSYNFGSTLRSSVARYAGQLRTSLRPLPMVVASTCARASLTRATVLCTLYSWRKRLTRKSKSFLCNGVVPLSKRTSIRRSISLFQTASSRRPPRTRSPRTRSHGSFAARFSAAISWTSELFKCRKNCVVKFAPRKSSSNGASEPDVDTADNTETETEPLTERADPPSSSGGGGGGARPKAT
mmetsp:Transcript_65233/g.172897  ORF Transcript_65233/g.172897 Transcript_65233/m.172897 type:complete len:249 (+) Transcript_65233:204-950(+)